MLKTKTNLKLKFVCCMLRENVQSATISQIVGANLVRNEICQIVSAVLFCKEISVMRIPNKCWKKNHIASTFFFFPGNIHQTNYELFSASVYHLVIIFIGKSSHNIYN